MDALQEDWIPGYGISYGMFVELFLHCLFGTKATISVSSRKYNFLIEANNALRQTM